MNPNNSTILALICVLVFAANSVAQQTKQPDPAKVEAQAPESTRAQRPFIGIEMLPTDDNTGVHINRVIAGTPAHQSGLLVDDVIIRMGDTEIPDRMALVESIAQHKIGDVVTLEIRRGEKRVEIELTLRGVPDSQRRLGRSKPKQAVMMQARKFPSEDGLEITGELYLASDDTDTPFIVLCHQAGWSRGEYREIAPRLNELGFNCLAIDQRSGETVNDVANVTAIRAAAAKKGTAFLDAEQDMIAALKWARANQASGKVILWGSSYSAALAIRIAGEHPPLVDGVLAFAPGEYFARFGKAKDWIAVSAKRIKVPVFITSAKNEFPRWETIYDAVPGDSKAKFVPETNGNHGSRALWAKFSDSAEYWKNVETFLAQFK